MIVISSVVIFNIFMNAAIKETLDSDLGSGVPARRTTTAPTQFEPITVIVSTLIRRAASATALHWGDWVDGSRCDAQGDRKSGLQNNSFYGSRECACIETVLYMQ